MIVTSPSSKFPGTVTLPDVLMLPAVAAWEEAIHAVNQVKPEATIGEIMASSSLAHLALPGVLACVERWNVAGIPEQPTVETFPYTPLTEAQILLGVILTEIVRLVEGEQVPPA